MTHGRYSTDLTDRQWVAIADLVPAPKPGGRPAKSTRREVVNAILYQTRNGCTWRDLPRDLPPYRVAFHYFRAWQRAPPGLLPPAGRPPGGPVRRGARQPHREDRRAV